MSSRRTVVAAAAWLSHALLIALVVGCQPPPKPGPPPPPPPRSMADAERVQADLQVRDRGARAGLVVAVKATEDNAAVQLAAAASNADPIKEGDVFTFTDSNDVTIAAGSVTYIENGIYVVHYVPSSGGGRAPMTGDVAIHVTTR
jgi:hypothetical protein